MVVLDTDFQKRYYNFTFVRREFLGEVRCLVIDVQPKAGQKVPRFMGRIWVEDQDYNIVRFNGTYFPQPKINFFFHFDSWRLNLRPGTWLPAYIYTEESNLKTGLTKTLHFKAQTRLWGYDLKGLEQERGVHARFWWIRRSRSKTRATLPPTPLRWWPSACGRSRPKTTRSSA